MFLVRKLHGYANGLCESHLEHVQLQPWLHLLFFRDVHGHANALLESHL